MQLLDGKYLSTQIKNELFLEVEKIKAKNGKIPHLVALLVGNDGASETYVASKIKACGEVGFRSTLLREPATISEEKLLQIIQNLNNDAEVDGFIVQFPLPKHISENLIIQAIAPEKDVDGFHPINVGRIVKGLPAYISATPFGILQMLGRYDIQTAGKHCVVLGRSQIVGTPMAILMGQKQKIGNCTVTMCHSQTENIEFFTKNADIIIAAIGIPEFLTADMVKEGAIVIDVGITRVEDLTKKSGYKLKGDVKFDEVSQKASYITPVPGGVGLMTVCALMQNTLTAAKKGIYSDELMLQLARSF